MRATIFSAIVAAIVASGSLLSAPAVAGRDENPDGFGLYSPDPQHRTYRYDSRSWYYSQRGHYPFYASGYWVPRAEMRYRYRRQYYGPKFKYYPAWGYPRPDYYDGGW